MTNFQLIMAIHKINTCFLCVYACVCVHVWDSEDHSHGVKPGFSSGENSTQKNLLEILKYMSVRNKFSKYHLETEETHGHFISFKSVAFFKLWLIGGAFGYTWHGLFEVYVGSAVANISARPLEKDRS